MILAGARVAVGADEAVRADLRICGDRVSFGARAVDEPVLDAGGCLILPGLINAHDHLEFGLFPRLGCGPYPNATAWAEDIYRPEEPPVRDLLRIPKSIRLFWGGVRNLVNGVTSVLHHNPYDPGVFDASFPVRVIANYGWAHSLRFSADVAAERRRAPAGAPFLIHACEGTDTEARGELERLDAAGVLDERAVLVHGVALDDAGIALLEARRAALVWCPSSNRFTLGRSVAAAVLRSRIRIALGTDSSISAAGDLHDELRVASEDVDPPRLYRMVTTEAASILRLGCGEGRIVEGGLADLLVVADSGRTPAEALLDYRPELVLIGGAIRLASPGMVRRLRLPEFGRFRPLEIEGRGSWYTDCEVAALAAPVREAAGGVRLAGRTVAS